MEFTPWLASTLLVFSLERQVLVTLDLPIHPPPTTTDCTPARYTTAVSHDVVYLPILFLACEPGFRLFLARESSFDSLSHVNIVVGSLSPVYLAAGSLLQMSPTDDFFSQIGPLVTLSHK